MPSRQDSITDHAVVTSATSKRKGERDFAFKSGGKLEKTDGQTAAPITESNLSLALEPPRFQAETVKQAVLNPKTSADGKTAENVVSTVNQTARRKKDKPENWLRRRGHTLTYALLFAFTFVLYFRPYEMFPALSSLSSMAFYLAIGTLLIYLPSQIATENSLTARPSEVNYVLLLALFGLITIPIARSPALAWDTFNEPFIKVVLMFIVMVNVIRTEARLKGMIWLALGVGVTLSVEVVRNYLSGEMLIEDYRAMANVKGMFGNPNAQALHFVVMTPIAIALGVAARNFLFRTVYFALAALFATGNMLTFSRGGFLGLMLSLVVLVWKLGRENRVPTMLIFGGLALIAMMLVPGNYGLRVLSIFIPALDPVGSSTERKDLLWTSIIVTLRNPWGIGMNNFTLVNPRALVTHNSYTQVSSELGVLALYCYMMLILNPLRRLFRMEKELAGEQKFNWIYYLTIGLQASLAGFCIGSFFDSAAYQWFLYYLVAYAICLRRIYQLQTEKTVS